MPGRHGDNRLNDYMNAHYRRMEDFRRSGFVVHDGLVLGRLGNTLIMQGDIDCLDNICLRVEKEILILSGDGERMVVRRGTYSYNARVRGKGNILRYDGPHQHRPFHHVHRYNTFGGGAEISVDNIDNEDMTPTLGDVINELEGWHAVNAIHLNR